MASISEYIEELRKKPEPVRQRIAFGVATGVTGLIAVVWMTTLATSGTLAIKSTGTTLGGGPGSATIVDELAKPVSSMSNLMGAVGAAFGATSTEAALNIIETRTSSTIDTRATTSANKTIIPF